MKRTAINNLYVEYLIVTDETILSRQKIILNTNNNAIAFLHMKIYYSHIVNAVC